MRGSDGGLGEPRLLANVPANTYVVSGLKPMCLLPLRGCYTKISTFFKELTPRSRTYELRGHGKKKDMYQIKTNKQLTLSYKNYLQKRYTPPSFICVCLWLPGTPSSGIFCQMEPQSERKP